MIDTEIIQDPVAQRALAERRELFRTAAVSMLKRRGLKPDDLAWAKRWAAIPPLQGPMGTGDPVQPMEAS
jgi:hypothetical protein